MQRYTFLFIFLCSSIIGHQSIELYNHLNKLIDYVKTHKESQKPDLMLGIYLCEGINKKKFNIPKFQACKISLCLQLN